MGIIDRLLLREIVKTLLVILLILTMVLLANFFVRYLGKAAVGALSTDILLVVVGLEVVKTLGLIVPPALFFSVLWVLGRMHRDSEMVALAASGFGEGRLYRSVLTTAVPLAIVVTVMVMELLPWARAHVAELKASDAESADISAVRAGRFNEFSRGGLVVYTESLSKAGFELKGVFVQDRQRGRLGLVTADSAYQTTDPETGERFVILTDGRRFAGHPGDLDFTIGHFDEYAIRIPELDLVGFSLPASAKSWQALLASESRSDHAEFQYRASTPLALIAFAVLAVPLARSPPRSGIYGRLTFAVLLYFTFINLQRVVERWLETGFMPMWMGMWSLPLLMLAVALLINAADAGRFRHWRGHRRARSA
ncbi:MAG: LPS export ABC transporter permease LptF [Gammaproteobacteria bacterium]|nr:LPS export ABC transporter permease LptF [Gammaproteobacteria bacterium]MCP5299218.1 LPS export ABC transporter permease LptF [Chromatiaceae bacterium]